MPSFPSFIRKQWDIFQARNIEVGLYPRPTINSFKPGEFIELKVRLGRKVTLDSYEKLEISLIGMSSVAGDPPDHHCFLNVKHKLLPIGIDPTAEERNAREWRLKFELPLKSTCPCRGFFFQLPPTYDLEVFNVRYFFKIEGKRRERFSINDTLEIPINISSKWNSCDQEIRDVESRKFLLEMRGGWSQVLASRTCECFPIKVRALRTEILDAKLSTFVTSVTTRRVQINYVLCLYFPGNDVLLSGSINAVLSSVRISLSRKVMIRKFRRKTGGYAWTEGSPSKRVESKVQETGRRMARERDCTVLRLEGKIEVPKSEVTICNVCNADVMYKLSAYAPASAGLSSDLIISLPMLDFNPSSPRRTISFSSVRVRSSTPRMTPPSTPPQSPPPLPFSTFPRSPPSSPSAIVIPTSPSFSPPMQYASFSNQVTPPSPPSSISISSSSTFSPFSSHPRVSNFSSLPLTPPSSPPSSVVNHSNNLYRTRGYSASQNNLVLPFSPARQSFEMRNSPPDYWSSTSSSHHLVIAR